eukprot:gb/GFBE01074280.1/.p1 GENE.gb/GFBE01074280.1/~~gb/GFBE01074280.1/.p1  ORF type:complete len:193 (+),score=42.65 gb/GFBE01074280.1/:1-579(+)
MGGCESCASSRRKEVETLIDDATAKGDSRGLREAIQRAEDIGMDVLAARQTYAQLAKSERQSPDRAQEMLRWALSTQDGVVLLQVIQEVQQLCPQSTGLRPARRRLYEFQAEVKVRLQKHVRFKDAQKLAATLDRARQMGIPPEEMSFAEIALKHLEELPSGASLLRSSMAAEASAASAPSDAPTGPTRELG